MDQVDEPTSQGDAPAQGRAQEDIGDLAYGGEGQPALEVVLEQGAQGAVDDGNGGQGCHRLGAPQSQRQIQTENIQDDPHHAESPGLNHRHGME